MDKRNLEQLCLDEYDRLEKQIADFFSTEDGSDLRHFFYGEDAHTAGKIVVTFMGFLSAIIETSHEDPKDELESIKRCCIPMLIESCRQLLNPKSTRRKINGDTKTTEPN